MVKHPLIASCLMEVWSVSSRKTYQVGAAMMCVAVAVFGLSACGSGGAGASGGETITLTASWPDAEGSPGSKAAAAFADFLAEESDGRIKVEPYFAGSLHPATEGLKAVGSGVSDVSIAAAAWTPSDLPITNWLAPLIGAEANTGNVLPVPTKYLVDNVTLDTAFQSDPVVDELASKQVMSLAGLPFGPQMFECAEPVTSLADVEGLRVRSVGAVYEPEYKALGIVGVTLGPYDQVEALQRGTIDCGAFGIAPAAESGLLEVGNHLIPVPLSASSGMLIFSQATFDSLSEKDQALVLEAGRIYGQAHSKFTVMDSADKLAAAMDESGLRVVMAPEIDDALLAQQDKNLEAMLASPPSGITDEQAAELADAFNAAQAEARDAAEEAGLPVTTPATAEEFVDSWKVGSVQEAIDSYFSAASAD